jgi:hypothetical protein
MVRFAQSYPAGRRAPPPCGPPPSEAERAFSEAGWIVERGRFLASGSLPCTAAAGTDACPEFDRLVGSRLAVANLELRLPLLGNRDGFTIAPGW